MRSDLLARLEGLRGAEKTVQEVGPTMMDWVSLTLDSLDNNKPFFIVHISFLNNFFILKSLLTQLQFHPSSPT